MKTATVQDLRDRFESLVGWMEAGEEIVITRAGKAIARLIPERLDAEGQVDWSQSPAVKRDRSPAKVLSAKESATLISEAGGKW